VYPVALRDDIRTWVEGPAARGRRAAARHFGLSRNTGASLLEEEPARQCKFAVPSSSNESSLSRSMRRFFCPDGTSPPSERRYERQVRPKTPMRDCALPHIEKWLADP